MGEAIDLFCRICRGEETEICSVAESSGFPHFRFICSLFQLFRNEIEGLGIENCAYLVGATVECLLANGRETQRYATVRDEDQEDEFYYYGRESTVGIVPIFEFACVYSNIILSKTMREDPLLHLFVRRICRVSLIVNDLFSIKKEIANGEKFNILLIRGKKMGGSAALEQTLQDLESTFQEITSLEKKLESKYENSSHVRDLKRYLEQAKANVDANTQWMLMSERYGQPPFVAHLLDGAS